jgi:hypothetical protein
MEGKESITILCTNTLKKEGKDKSQLRKVTLYPEGCIDEMLKKNQLASPSTFK